MNKFKATNQKNNLNGFQHCQISLNIKSLKSSRNLIKKKLLNNKLKFPGKESDTTWFDS